MQNVPRDRQTRRTFLRGATLLAGASLLAACAPTQQTAPTTAAKPTDAPKPAAPSPAIAPAAAPSPATVPSPAAKPAASPSPAAATSASPAADLRVALNNLLQEHVMLASIATGHALGGREPAFKAAAESLDTNSVDLSKAIGSAYGTDAEKAFLPLWRSHIEMFVAYTQGTAANDKAKQDKAVADLTKYTEDVGAFFNAANGLPKDTVAGLVKDHVLTLKDVVDAQAARDWPKAFGSLRKADDHMKMVADPLAAATVRKFPDKFAGMADSRGATLRVGMNTLLQEHTDMAAMATGAALGGRDDEFKAAAESLDTNSVDLSKAIGSAYGTDAERAFLPLWRSHIEMFVAYTQGTAANDKAKQDKAVADLTKYTEDVGAFFNAANGLPKDTVAGLVKTHVLTLKDVVDAQAARDWPKVYPALRQAAGHMPMVADPLAEATVKKFPDKFS